MKKPHNHPLLAMLTGGDRRSVGRSNDVVAAVLKRPALIDPLFGGLSSDDCVVRMRVADALEKVSRAQPELLNCHKTDLLGRMARSLDAEVRWHVAQILPRLCLTADERTASINILEGYLDDRSSIVKTCAMQALAEFAESDRRRLPCTLELIDRLVRDGTPAMAARGRGMLERLRKLAAAA